MTGLINTLSCFIYMVWEETRYLASHKNRASYLIFILIFTISLYGIGIQTYSTEQINDKDIIGGMKMGESPLIDFLIFMFIFGMRSLESASKGVTPEIIMPVELGITLVAIFSILLGINMVSRLVVRGAASSISREKEAKTLYLIGATPNSRSSIYLAKLTGSLLASVPLIAVMIIGVLWISASVFVPLDPETIQPKLNELTIYMVVMTLSTIILFASMGTLVSVYKDDEESAVNLSVKFTTIAATLTTLWILLPIFNVTGEKISAFIETLTLLSPITLDLIVLYEHDPTLLLQYSVAQLLAAVAFIIIGIIVFIRQDIEY